MNDKPVKQQSAADYLGVEKADIKVLFTIGVDRSGPGEGKVKVSDCFAALLRLRAAMQCPTCGTDCQKPAVPDGE